MGSRGVGYIGIESTDPAKWETYGTDVLGLMATSAPSDASAPGSTWLRMDRRHHRIAVHPGSADRCAYVGWEYADGAALEHACARVEAAGVPVKQLDADEARARGVKAGARFDDPWGNTNELFFGQAMDEEQFVSPQGVSGFLTEGVGVGHVLYAVPSSWDAANFYISALDFKLTDFMTWGPNSAIFLHTTRRHHSIAFVDLPLPGGHGLNHFMIEANTVEDVGRAYDRTKEAGVPIVNSLGQHVNDPMFSFYMQSPSGFNVEFGWNGLMIDEDTWVASEWSGRGEIWGHTGEFMDDIADAKEA
jgi:3,4-dihydroxy-9,10-secoandrosta-1,3,5(10)-triene-9,17-dione 4,5-dioxygenase